MRELENAAQRRFGTVVGGKWTLKRLLGVGAMGAVYEARHHNGHRVAIKVLHAHHVHHRTLVARLRQEARLANQIDHASVVRVLDDGTTEDGAPFLVSELLEGKTLEEELAARGGRLPLEEVLKIGRELLLALEVAHARGVLHRDIKPANLFLIPSGELRILDFGLGSASDGHDDRLTSTDTVLGTVGFMAPEQAAGRWDLVDLRTDLWAVGATLLKLATGLDAHQAVTAQERLAFAATRPVATARLRDPSLSPAFATALDTAMAFTKAARFQDARAMREALEVTDVKTGTPAAGSLVRKKSARGWAPWAAMVALLGTVAAFALAGAPRLDSMQGPAPPPGAPAIVSLSPPTPTPTGAVLAPLTAGAPASPLPPKAQSAPDTSRRFAPGTPVVSGTRTAAPSASREIEAPAPAAPLPSVDPMDRRR